MGTHLLCLLLKSFIKNQGQDKKKLSISAVNLFINELPDIKVFLEDNDTLYSFNGVYDGCRSVSSKLLRLMQNDETEKKGADKQ